MSRRLIPGTNPCEALPEDLIERTRAIFDAGFYISRNPDVAASGIDPYEHFMTFGWREGRDPSVLFKTLFYKDTHLTGSGDQNPLLHACLMDQAAKALPLTEDEYLDVQRRVTEPFFDAAFYASTYGAASDEQALEHYLRRGWREGREPNAGFSSEAYLAGATHVRSLGISPFYHCASTNPDAARSSREAWQSDESRAARSNKYVAERIGSDFDATFYRDTNADIRDTIDDPVGHFIEHGCQEGRNPNRWFDVRYYLAQNADVRALGMNPLLHYIEHGRAEGRRPRPSEDRTREFFDADFYRLSYGDIAAEDVDPHAHYMAYGWREGRNPSKHFNTMFFKDRDPKADDGTNPFVRFCEGHDLSLGVPASDGEFLDVQTRIVAPFFDADFYATSYGLSRDIDLLGHYLTKGWRLGYEPHARFSTMAYLREHMHAAMLGVSPFYHCASFEPDLAWCCPPSERGQGATAPRCGPTTAEEVIEAIEDEFDTKYYLRLNGDVKESSQSAIEHFVGHGWKEGRNPNRLFDTRFYLEQNEDVRQSGINPLLHYMRQGRAEARKPNPAGHTLWPATRLPSAKDWVKAKPARDAANAEAVVIIPVYDGLEDTLASVHAVLTNEQQTPFVLLVINDKSSNPALTEALRDLAAQGMFVYHENEVNLGFVKTVNRGLSMYAHLDAILLNADAIVFGNWLDRMLWHAKDDSSIATVTPFSNHASICSYPVSNFNNTVALEVDGAALDALTAVCNKKTSIEIPTGVGFCFYIRRSVLDEIGGLDEEVFGRGYGEENDFCMRALKAGFKNICAQDIFVYHAGEVSLGSFYAQEFEPGQMALRAKHPDYPTRCQRFIDSNPGLEARLRLDLMRLAHRLNGKAFVFVVHAMTGGVLTHIDGMTAQLRAEGAPVITIKVAVDSADKIEICAGDEHDLYMPSLTPFSATKFRDLLTNFFTWLQPRLVHVHSFAGMSWPATKSFVSALRRSKSPYAYTFHDYGSVCHRNHLVRPDATYCGLPSTKACRSCVRLDRDCEDVVDPDERRRFFEAFFNDATKLFAPSLDIKSRMERVFKTIRPEIRYHPEIVPMRESPPRPGAAGPLRVAIIGAIGPCKGSNLLHALALDASMRELPLEMTIVGHSDMRDVLERVGVTETGRYRNNEDVFAALDELQPHVALFCSIWPETHSYTLSLALAAGIPPVVLDIGAQAERLRRYDVGHILPFELMEHPELLNDALLQIPLDGLWSKRKTPAFATYASLCEDYYGLA